MVGVLLKTRKTCLEEVTVVSKKLSAPVTPTTGRFNRWAHRRKVAMAFILVLLCRASRSFIRVIRVILRPASIRARGWSSRVINSV